MAITTNNTRYKVFVNQTDYTDYVVPESIRYRNELARGAIAELQLTIKQMPGGFSAAGGQRLDLYLPGELQPMFSGQVVQNEPMKHSVGAWSYKLSALSWENVFYRKKSYIQFRNLTYLQAIESVLQDTDQNFPTVISDTVTDTDTLLTGAMPFHSFSGQYPAEIFNYIARLTNSNWRIIPGSTVDEFKVEFYDPFIYRVAEPLLFTNSTDNFMWKSLAPVIETGQVVNAQTVRGAIVPATGTQVALFRGDGLNSKFPLPLKPYSNLNRIEIFDQFEGTLLDKRVWLESDTGGDHVYLDGNGFLQFDISTSPEWVGIESTANIERVNKPIGVWDITWLSNGRALLGFSDSVFSSSTPTSFLDAGVYIDTAGLVYTVFNGATAVATTLTLSLSTQYRFRIVVDETAGASIYYQTGANTFTRNWTLLATSATGNSADLQFVTFSFDANYNVDMVKCTNPYLGITVEVDRGLGYVEEVIGVYPIDEDVDVVLEGEQTISFFGSDPGPSTIPPAPAAKTFTTSDLVNDIMTISLGHAIRTGAAIKVSSTTTLPAGLSAGVTYYLRSLSFTTFALYDTLINAQNTASTTGRLNITDAGTGTHTMTPNEWATASSDYKNIRVTYSPGQRLQATFRDSESIALIASLYGLGDTGVREGDVIIDERLTSYTACLSRAQLEVSNRNQIIREIQASTTHKILSDAGYSQPKLGQCSRFFINIDATDYDVEGDIPVTSVLMTPNRNGTDFQFQLTAGYIERGLKDVLANLQNSLFISISDNELVYQTNYNSETLTAVDSVNAFTMNPMTYWGDTRRNIAISSINTGTELITTASTTLQTGDTVTVKTTGTLPTGITALTTYYINRQSATTYYLFDTLANAIAGGATGKVNISSAGSGTHTIVLSGFRWNRTKWSTFTTNPARIYCSTGNLTSFTVA